MLNTRWLSMMVFGADWASDTVTSTSTSTSSPQPYTFTNYGIFPLGNTRQRII